MWRAQTFQDILTAVIRNPDWIVLLVEVCGVVYFFRMIHLACMKVRRAMFTVKVILVMFALSAIVYACWNYLYINGENPFTHATLENYNGYMIYE